MSIRVYRLLRNNKEEGPFTAEELIQKNLRPYDLIWIDGRSAAWSYPGELAQFKKYVPLPGEENVTTQTAKPAVSASVQAAIAVNDNISKPEIKEKPRYKISAAWSKIQTVTRPAVANTPANPGEKIASKKNLVNSQASGIPVKPLSWEEAWLDWKKEKKTAKQVEPVRARPAAPPATKRNEEPVLETKYAEPLDSLKDKYIENLLHQKQRSKKSISIGKASEFILPTIALLVIFSVAYWFLHTTKTTVPDLSTGQLKQEKVEPAPVTNAAPPAGNTINDSVNAIAQNPEPVVRNVDEPQPAAIEKAEERKSSSTHNYKTPVAKHPDISNQPSKLHEAASTSSTEAAEKKTADIKTKSTKPVLPANTSSNTANSNTSEKTTGNPGAGNTAPIRNKTNIPAVTGSTAIPDVATESRKSREKMTMNYVNVPEYIQMNDGSANIKIRNVSDIDLDLVVVDVQYYDASSRFRKGETLYLHNLKAGRDIVIKTPKDTNSLYATSKISLISSDAKQVYVIGDN